MGKAHGRLDTGTVRACRDRSADRMKAEHRKELHTNLLADRMGRALQSIKEGPKSTSAITWMFIILALGTFTIWKLYASAKVTEYSSLWVSIDKADSTPNPAETVLEFQKVADQHRGTSPGRVARFQLARIELEGGLQNLASEQRPDAIKSILEARKQYEQLARECTDAPLLKQEALMCVAKSEEALAAVPNPDDPGQTYGSLERALDYYQQLARDYPGSFQGAFAEQHIKELDKSPAGPDDLSAEQFYTRFNELASAKPKLRVFPPPETKTTPKPDAEAKGDAKSEPKTESKSEPKAAPKDEPKAALPESKPASKPVATKPETKTEPKAEPKTEAKPKAP